MSDLNKARDPNFQATVDELADAIEKSVAKNFDTSEFLKLGRASRAFRKTARSMKKSAAKLSL